MILFINAKTFASGNLSLRGSLYETFIYRTLVPFVQFKNVKKRPWRSVILVKLKASACNFTKSNTLPWMFSCFLNCTNGTKSPKVSDINHHIWRSIYRLGEMSRLVDISPFQLLVKHFWSSTCLFIYFIYTLSKCTVSFQFA